MMETDELIDLEGLVSALSQELPAIFGNHGVEVTSDAFSVEDNGISMPHWVRYIESGTAPTNTPEQRAAIALSLLESGWNKKRGISDDDVWAVATSISKKGSKTYQKGGDYFIAEEVDKWLDKNLEKYVLNKGDLL